MSGSRAGAQRSYPLRRSNKPTGVGRQRGAMIITVAFSMLALLAFMSIAIDFGHLFVVKTELQTAADSCALAAAQELDGASDALTRATNAGMAVGNANSVNFQGSSAGFVAEDITFSSSLVGSYSGSEPVGTARYVRCAHTQGGMAPWLMQALSAISGNDAYSADQSVSAVAVATLEPAQTACAIPVQIRPKAGGSAPNYGYTKGEWIPSVYSESGGPGGGGGGGGGKGGGGGGDDGGADGGTASNDLEPGHFGWANLDGSNSATEAREELLSYGACNLRYGDTIGTPGAMVSLRTAWNSRFGLYVSGTGQPKIESNPPDLTGYSYTATNWPPATPGTPRANALEDYLAKRAANASYGNTTDTVNAGDTLTGLKLSGAYKNDLMGTHGDDGERALGKWGTNRRLVLAPIVVGGKIAAFACILMLHPITGPNVTVNVEFIGNAKTPGSPCSSVGLPGGSEGPSVPSLVL